MPDITRVFKGPENDFEVEIVYAGSEDTSPKEAHEYVEYIFVAKGSMSLSRSDQPESVIYTAPATVEIPCGVEHVIDVREDGSRLIVIHPDRTDV